MFGVRTTQVFTSRWKALIWSAGVLLTAYCSIPPAEESAPAGRPGPTGQPDDQDLQVRKIVSHLDSLKSD